MTSTTSKLLTGAIAGLAMLALAVPAFSAGKVEPSKDIDFSFEGPFGTFDRAQLQRGYLVYKEVCAACHAMSYVYFRNLSQPGGPEFSEAQVKAIAAEFEVTSTEPNSDGDYEDRPAEATDRFPSPFPNEQAARSANGGAYPLDLSLLTKSRVGWTGDWYNGFTTQLFKGSGGPEYIYSLLIGYQDPPEGEEKEGLWYNKYFPGNWIAMPPPLSDDLVEYGDGTAASADQMARDVAAFMMWTAEPKLEERKELGFKVILYMILLTVLLYLTKNAIWARVKNPKAA